MVQVKAKAMKLSDIFRRAKRRISTGYDVYICVAIRFDARLSDRDKTRAINVIFERIHKRPRDRYEVRYQITGMPLDVWIAKTVPNPDMSSGSMRAYRVRWLDALIKEFEAKND